MADLFPTLAETATAELPTAAAMKPLCIELFAGLSGWGEGFLAEGWDVIGFDLFDMATGIGETGRNIPVLNGHTHSKDGDKPMERFTLKVGYGQPIDAHGLSVSGSRLQIGRMFSTDATIAHALGQFIYLRERAPITLRTAHEKAGCTQAKVIQQRNSPKIRCVKPEDASRLVSPNGPSPDLSKFTTTRFGRSSTISNGNLRSKAASAQIAKIPFPLASHIARVYYPDHKPQKKLA